MGAEGILAPVRALEASKTLSQVLWIMQKLREMSGAKKNCIKAQNGVEGSIPIWCRNEYSPPKFL